MNARKGTHLSIGLRTFLPVVLTQLVLAIAAVVAILVGLGAEVLGPVLIGGGVAVLALSAVTAIAVATAVVRPLARLASMVKDIAEGEGDLTRKIDVAREDEIGHLAQSINGFIGKQRDLIRRIRRDVAVVASASTRLSSIASDTTAAVRGMSETAATVAAAAEESSANTASVAAGMTSASSNLSSIAVATEEMSATVGDIAANSEKARHISEQATHQAQAISALMRELGQAAQEIGKVTETITGISSQTNLLALNATIEAARAGAAGKGFAVVANEVKALAKQTSVATEDIRTRISSVQSSTTAALADIDRIAKVITEVGNIVASIAVAIEEQSAVTKDVATNIAQASSGVKEADERVAQTAEVSRSIARDIAGVHNGVTGISQSGEKVQARAAELSLLADQLNEAVRRFKVDDGTEEPEAVVEDESSRVLMPWREEWSVAVSAMDDQHKKLIDLINRLHAAMERGEGAAATEGVIKELVDYTVYHFGAEEERMQRAQYPGYPEQKRAHTMLIEKCRDAQKRWAAGDRVVTQELLKLLMNWLPQHILKLDKQYSPYLNKVD